MHIVDGGMQQRGLCKFMGRGKKPREGEEGKPAPFADHTHPTAMTDAWEASTKHLPNSGKGRGDRPARWVKPTRMTVDRSKAKPKVDKKRKWE